MTPTQITFVETFVALLATCALSFWGGRVSRDKEVDRLRSHRDHFKESANRLEQNRDDWKETAQRYREHAFSAEAQLASLPKRGQGGKFEKRK